MEIKEGPFRSIQKSTKTGGIRYIHWKLKKGPLGPPNKATVASYYVTVALNKATVVLNKATVASYYVSVALNKANVASYYVTVALNKATVASYKATVALLIGPPLEGAMRNLY